MSLMTTGRMRQAPHSHSDTGVTPEPRKAVRNGVRIPFLHNVVLPLPYRSRQTGSRDCLHSYKVAEGEVTHCGGTVCTVTQVV